MLSGPDVDAAAATAEDRMVISAHMSRSPLTHPTLNRRVGVDEYSTQSPPPARTSDSAIGTAGRCPLGQRRDE